MSENPPTGIVLLNLGGPSKQDEVQPFLLRLFADREIIQLPWQSFLGPFIAKRRTPKVKKLYQSIGGGSPIKHWTETQGKALEQRMDALSPETAPHKFYIAFRYADPQSDHALQKMKEDGVTRAIAFTQYPQFSCTTTGSSLNELWRASERTDLTDAFEWSVIDRWHTHPGFIKSMTACVNKGLAQIPESDRDKTVILFSAHSLPMRVIERGDSYPAEICATVDAVLRQLDQPYRHLVTYQSQVGPVKWLGPQTEDVIESLAQKGHRQLLVVPIAFTSDHVETLVEIDHEFAEVAEKAGITHFVRAPALNDEPLFLDAMADIVHAHLQSGAVCSTQYGMRCPGCINPHCRNILNPSQPSHRSELPTSI